MEAILVAPVVLIHLSKVHPEEPHQSKNDESYSCQDKPKAESDHKSCFLTKSHCGPPGSKVTVLCLLNYIFLK